MPVFDENGKQITTEEGFPKMKDPEENQGFGKPARKGFPMLPAALGVIALVFIIIAVIYMIKASTLEQEVEILNKTKTQLSTMETKLQEMTKENNKIRSEVTHAKGEIDTLRAKNQALEDQLAKMKAAASAPKKDTKTAAKKTPPKKPKP
jgi:TolA-binding protein